MKKIFICIAAAGILACSHDNAVKQQTADSSFVKTTPGIVIADTIIYDVIIRNPNPDDSWSAYCLKGLQRADLVDSLFKLVYEGRIAAYDYDTHAALKPKDVKRIEASGGFAREKIGKIQFTEKWFYNPSGKPITKEIISIVPGYEVYTSTGELMGYKPVFLLRFN
jgi:hypothetical protein